MRSFMARLWHAVANGDHSVTLLAVSLCISTVEHNWIFLQVCHPCHLSVGLSVRWVSCICVTVVYVY